MLNSRLRVFLVTLFFSLALLAEAQPSKVDKGQTRKAKSSPILELPPPEPMPIPEMTSEELPPRAPQVSYRDGKLTISASNATLASILNAIQTETGATITIPDESSERVAVNLSGPPNIVIPQLIDGSKFGYIIRSSPDDPEGVSELILNRKPGTGAQPAAQALASQGQPDIRSLTAEKTMQFVTPKQLAQHPPTNLQPIAAMETDKTVDKAALGNERNDDVGLAAATQASVITIDDPHPTSPLQLTTLQQTSDPAQQVVNRQFMQELYSARQKLQPQQAPQRDQQPQ